VHIFTTPSTFHGTPIDNHDLEIINWMDITIEFSGNVALNKIMGVVLDVDPFWGKCYFWVEKHEVKKG
jgi:hypothetical protein